MKYEVAIKFSNIDEKDLDEFQEMIGNIRFDLDSNIKIDEGLYYEQEEKNGN